MAKDGAQRVREHRRRALLSNPKLLMARIETARDSLSDALMDAVASIRAGGAPVEAWIGALKASGLGKRAARECYSATSSAPQGWRGSGWLSGAVARSGDLEGLAKELERIRPEYEAAQAGTDPAVTIAGNEDGEPVPGPRD